MRAFLIEFFNRLFNSFFNEYSNILGQNEVPEKDTT